MDRKKIQNDSKNQEEKIFIERQRNLMVLIQKYLLNQGYIDSVQRLQAECGLSLEKWYL